jgi:uncharacterized small protein (DUF1192 family)
MEIVELADAIACLGEEISQLRLEQVEQGKSTGESLRLWSQINADLMNCLQGQAEDYRGSVDIQQMLAQHLLTLCETTQQLTLSTKGLEASSETLMLYLKEKQAPQLVQLEKNSKQLQDSSSKLETYLVTEQEKRLAMLENGLRSLLGMIENSQKNQQPLLPPTSQSQAPVLLSPSSNQKKQSFDVVSLTASVILSSVTTVCLLLSLWQFGGVGRELTRIAERSEWSLIKLERLESVLGTK